MEVLTERDLDTLLALQCAVAWAGEQSVPARLGWWASDLVDPDAGGDLFRRLLPRTGAWAALATVRELARRTEERGLLALGEGVARHGLFSLGFLVDEQLDRRLLARKLDGSATSALPWPVALEGFSFPALREALSFERAPYRAVGAARELESPRPASSLRAARLLAGALFDDGPAPARYPLPHFCVRP